MQHHEDESQPGELEKKIKRISKMEAQGFRYVCKLALDEATKMVQEQRQRHAEISLWRELREKMRKR